MVGARTRLAFLIASLALVATACPPDPGTTPTSPSTTIGPAPTPAVQVSSGSSFSCARLDGNSVKCWGRNANGELGRGNEVASGVPVSVTGLSGVVQVSSGGSHSCALILGGTITCWGLNTSFELGNPSISAAWSNVPVPVPGITGAAQVSSGDAHTCALLLGGTITCWGAGANGRLGSGVTTASTPNPVTVVGITDAVEVAAGGSHTCARLGSGAVKCWGYNLYGNLGDGSQGLTQNTPVTAVGVAGATQVVTGQFHTCALLAGGTAKCWGANSNGQLGIGTVFNSYTAVAVSGLTGAIGISAGAKHTCAVFPDNSAKCWGDNEFFQLGDGTGIDRTTPAPVANLIDGLQVDGGTNHTCALASVGHLRCWGNDADGQLGIGQAYGPLGSDTPVSVVGIP